jgi:trehalose/maltose transport system substrate-binding protein
MSRMSLIVPGIAAALACGLTIHASPAAAAVTLSIACGSVGAELAQCQKGVDAWEAETGNTVNVIPSPQSTSDTLALYQQILNAGSADIDVFQIDVIWPGILGSHFVDLKQFVDQATIDQHFPGIIEGLMRDGQLLALPWYTDAGLLYYRTDLLEKYGVAAPRTWDELTAAAETIQKGERDAGNDRFYGFVFQGRAYEGLTCNALEWIASNGGGLIVETDGTVSIDNPQAIAAIDRAAAWVRTITPEGVLNYLEEDARGVFQSGNAAFMRNWPYAYGLVNGADSPVAGKVGALALPTGSGDGARHAATLGGWQLAVSKYSAHQAEAADLVAYLTGREEQKRRAMEGAYQPTIPALYQDADVLKAQPFFELLLTAFENAVARPSAVTGERYNEVSTLFWNAVHATLSGKGDAAANLGKLEGDLRRLSRGGRW